MEDVLVRRVQAATLQLQSTMRDLPNQVDTLKKGKLPSALKAYKQLKDAYDALDEERKKIFEQLEFMSRSMLPEMMAEQDVKSTTIEFGEGSKFRFTVSQRVSASMPDKEGGMRWLRENGHEGLIQETVNSSSLASFSKTYTAETGRELPTEHFKVSLMAFTSVTKA